MISAMAQIFPRSDGSGDEADSGFISSHGTRSALLHRWLASGSGVVAALLVAVGALTWVLQTPTQFTGSSVFSLRPDPATPVSADILTITAHEYAAYVSSPQVLAEAAQSSGVSEETLRSNTAVSVETGTANVRIDVTLSSFEGAVQAANELASVAAAEGSTDPLVEAKVVSLATAQSVDTSPPRQLLLLITCALSVTVGLLVWYIVGRRRGQPAKA
jgi:hypothetical protein